MKRFSCFLFIIILAVFFVITQEKIEKNFKYPFQPMTTLKAKEVKFTNFWGVLLGLRRLSADLAWIDVLQYYGSHEEETEHKDEDEHEGEHVHEPGRECPHCLKWGEYKELLSRCQAIIRLDPYFHYAYLYGSGALAFNHNRFDEAVELLDEGVQNNPQYWRFRLYLAAIAYIRKAEYDKIIPLLEQVAFDLEAPTMIRNILAQIYEKKGEYYKAKLLWEYILNTAAEDVYIKRAKEHLEKIQNL